MNNKQPVKQSSKLKFELESDMPCHYALSTILLQNLTVLENCEPGIITDIDNEFLHTFRIAGRRSRTLLNQIKYVYPASRLSRFKKAFSWISEFTGIHRDLDVFLTDFSQYEKRVGPTTEGVLDPLHDYLLSQRKQEHLILLNALGSQRYASFKLNWRKFLLYTEKHIPRTSNSSLPIVKVANKNIMRNYRKLIRQGKAISSNYDYESMHTLRKNAKKLRYLLDSFKSLYPPEEIKLAITALKKLQNNMGDIVDMHIQKCMLEKWKQELENNKNVSAQTLLAIKQLGILCDKNERTAIKKFKKRFNQFSVKTHQKLFNHMFKSVITKQAITINFK